MKEHENGCKCVICSGEMTRKELTEQENKLMEKHGWFAHMVIADPYVATGFNYHTHGFDKSLKHLDLQIVLPIAPEKCHSIAKIIYDQIGLGKKFKNGHETVIPGVDSRFTVRFIKVKEGDRDVLRVILPTPDGELEPKNMKQDDESEYALQWTVLT